MPPGNVLGLFVRFPAASRYGTDQQSSKVRTSYPAARRLFGPPATIPSAVCLAIASVILHAKWFQLFQPIVGLGTKVPSKTAVGKGRLRSSVRGAAGGPHVVGVRANARVAAYRIRPRNIPAAEASVARWADRSISSGCCTM